MRIDRVGVAYDVESNATVANPKRRGDTFIVVSRVGSKVKGEPRPRFGTRESRQIGIPGGFLIDLATSTMGNTNLILLL